ncbi:hypothetical protein KY345_02730 [Candidatus Woesearchaeota archaeon]|nr:hypothetical protein [Candidatus Woesearchaeota archaeon]
MRKVLFIMLILVFSILAYAEVTEVTEDTDIVESESGDFSVEVNAIENKILRGGTAQIELRIKNNENFTRRYRFGFDNTGEWIYIRTEPTYHALSGIDVEGPSSEKTTVILKAREETGYGTYFVKTTITNEDTGENVIVLLPVGIKTAEEIAGIRVPNLRVSLDVPTKMDPREENIITVYLLNKNNRNITELKIELESNLLGKKEIIESLEPNEEKEVKINLGLDPLTEPQEDTVKGVVRVGEYRFTPTAKTFEVIDYNTQLSVEPKTEKGFFRTTKIITIENKGNSMISDIIKSERGVISGIFTRTEPEARIVEVEGTKYYAWDVNVDPTVKSDIIITTNYQPAFWFIVLVVAVLIIQYTIKSKVRVFKKSTSTEMSEGGLSNIKILLTIRNDTGKLIKDIEVKDTVPHIAEIKKEFPMGTLKPEKILVHKTKGTIVKWKIDELDPSEERIIKYEMKSKLSIIGSFTLPATRVTYKTIRGRQRSVVSDRLIVGKE